MAVQLDLEAEHATLLVENPENRNALYAEDLDQLLRLARQAVDSGAKSLALRGTAGNFCTGTVVEGSVDPRAILLRTQKFQQFAASFAGLPLPTLAVVEGYAVGGGFELSLCCDFVLAAEDAQWGMPEVDLGLTPSWGVSRLVARAGVQFARQVLLLGAIHPAATAVERGIWDRLCPARDLDDAVAQWHRLIAVKNPQTLRQMKALLNSLAEPGPREWGLEMLSAGWSWAAEGHWRAPDGDDGRGVRGFTEGTPPWTVRRAASRDFWTG
ncbi:enoyl-CoA hydratase/isomerase family protein [Streptomyces sp. NPDC051243]|uniref:enoyl-CoA hydratase/isomerase family protein n=1 Tax=Streptomyces sp. NPDC051243 TaxID=3365646 RepID=UPI00378B4EBB